MVLRFTLSALAAAFFGSIMTPVLTLASQQVGTITQIVGEVKIFSNPSQKVDGEKPRALYEGEYFTVRPAKEGDKVDNGVIVRTHPGARARVIFDNGDQYNIGSASAYRVSWEPSAETKNDPQINLMYGKIRGIVSKGGPRSKLMIRTKNAVMGVRGTDFFVADDGTSGTEVSVIRGQVAVTPMAKAETATMPPKEVVVTSGQSADVAKTVTLPTIRKTTKEEFKIILKNSEFDAKMEALPEPLKKLEEKAKESVIAEVKKENPELLAKLDPGHSDATQLNAQIVQKLQEKAPSAPKRRKPFRSELEDQGDAYKKYFKEVD